MANDVCNAGSCGTGSWNGPLPGDPDNSSVLSAVSDYGGIQLSWTVPNINGYAVSYTKIFRSTANEFATAIPLPPVSGAYFFDRSAAEVIRQYFYWIQHVSINGTELSPIGPVTATAMPLINQVIQALANSIESSMLATSLRSRIDKIADLESGLNNVNTVLETETGVLATQLLGVRDDLTDAIAYIQESRSIDVTEREALVQTINTQLASIGGGDFSGLYAAIQEEATTRASETGELFAQKVLKIDLAGNVSGYGLSAHTDPDGTSTSDFQVRADTFSLAGPAVSQATEPTNPYNGKVWVDTSVTPNVTRWYNKTALAWQTTPVKGMVPFIVKTTPEVIDGYTVQPGVYIDNAVIGKLTADKIDGRGLTIRDTSGNVILSAGSAVDWTKLGGASSNLSGLGYTGALDATRNVHRGAWTASLLYKAGDVVTNSGSSWAAKVEHTSVAGTNGPPALPTTSNTWWELTAAKGDQGTPGLNGTRTAILEMYQWAAASPTTFPSGSSTYTWATGQFTAPATVNGWSLTPPAAVLGQTLWVCRTIFADSLTSTTSSIAWTASAAVPAGGSGSNGSPGTNGTRTAIVELYQWAAGVPTTFPSGTSTYTWATGAFTAPATPNGWSLTPGAAVAGQTLWGCSVSYADTAIAATSPITWNTSAAYAVGAAGTNGAAGAAAISAVMSNEAHVFPADSSGVVATYAGSGTELRVYEGATELTYDGVGTANGSWKATLAGTNITPGTLTDSGTYLTVGTHSAVAAGTDASSISYTITGKTASGTGFTITKVQTFSKSKQGAGGGTGPAGPAVVVVSSRTTTFTATDGNLDGSQADITFTALVSGIASPTYVWTFSGFQTAPTNSGASAQTITAAQFGTSKSAMVTCTVNGTYKDEVTVVRLEKSTAAAGATVGATIGVNLGGQITPANASTFIADAAIGTAQVGELDAVKIKARSIKTENIEIGAATASASYGSTGYNKVNPDNVTGMYTLYSGEIVLTNTIVDSQILVIGRAGVFIEGGVASSVNHLMYSAHIEKANSFDGGTTWGPYSESGIALLPVFVTLEGGRKNFKCAVPLFYSFQNIFLYGFGGAPSAVKFRVGLRYKFTSGSGSDTALNPNVDAAALNYTYDYGGVSASAYEFKV